MTSDHILYVFALSFWLGYLVSVAPLLWQQQSLTRLLLKCTLFGLWGAVCTLGLHILVGLSVCS